MYSRIWLEVWNHVQLVERSVMNEVEREVWTELEIYYDREVWMRIECQIEGELEGIYK